MSQVLDQIKSNMDVALEHFKQELKGLRTNRANPAVLDVVQVEVYGSSMRIKELASVTTPESRQLLISPFDPSTAGAIAKGIEKANIQLMPMLEGNIIRINVPPMDEAMRKEIVKRGKQKAEEAKVVIREVRRKGNEQVRDLKAKGEMTEDMMKGAEKKVQEFTDQFCKEIDSLFMAREKEIMTV